MKKQNKTSVAPAKRTKGETPPHIAGTKRKPHAQKEALTNRYA